MVEPRSAMKGPCFETAPYSWRQEMVHGAPWWLSWKWTWGSDRKRVMAPSQWQLLQVESTHPCPGPKPLTLFENLVKRTLERNQSTWEWCLVTLRVRKPEALKAETTNSRGQKVGKRGEILMHTSSPTPASQQTQWCRNNAYWNVDAASYGAGGICLIQELMWELKKNNKTPLLPGQQANWGHSQPSLQSPRREFDSPCETDLA